MVEIITSLLNVDTLIALVVGVCGGTIIGCLPGLSASMGVALLLPLTYSMDPIPAMVMLTAIYTCAIYGGSISAILIHTPGTPSSAATALDGYSMTLQGKGLKAVGFSTYSSMVGGVISAVALLTISPALSLLSLKFSSGEYFFIAIFGLTIIASVAANDVVKGLAAGAFGLIVACIGSDPMTGFARMTFGSKVLTSGINFVPALIGLFSVSQVMVTSETMFTAKKQEVSTIKGRFWPTRQEVVYTLPTVLKSSVIGVLVGILPGAGGDIASWIAYNLAKNSSKDPDSFGQGNPIGICASEAANNAVTGGSLIPLLTLGVPGSSVAAILLGGFLIQGMQPGRALFTTGATNTYSIILGFTAANILMGLFGFFVSKHFIKATLIPSAVMGPIIVVLSVVGAYAINRNIFDIYTMVFFGLLGYVMIKAHFSTAGIVLALVLGSTAETGYRQALVMSRGDIVGYFLGRPICVGLMVLIVISLALPAINDLRKRKAS